jgi:pilus assembly protein CpaB
MNRNTRTFVVLAVAVLVAAVATFLVYRAIVTMPVKQVEVAQIKVVVAAQPIRLGSTVSRDRVKLVGWPAASPVRGAFSTIDAVVGRSATAPLAENDVLTEEKLASRDSGAGLSSTITPGYRAMAIRVDEVIGVAGFVQPDSHVDVLATLTRDEEKVTATVASNVLVLTAGPKYDQNAPKRDGQPIPATAITLKVTPEDAERITLAQSEGRLMLALRNPADDTQTATKGVRLRSLFGAATEPEEPAPPAKARRVVAAPAPKPQQQPPPPPKAYTVETFRGMKRSEDPIK